MLGRHLDRSHLSALATSGMVPLQSPSKRSYTIFSQGGFNHTTAYDGLKLLTGKPA